MLNIPTAPKSSSHVAEKRSRESIDREREQNRRLRELGIDPYQYDIEEGYTEEEQDLINEVLKLIVLDKEVPEELEERVRQITGKQQHERMA